MSIYQILCLAGIPSLVSMFIGFVIARVSSSRKQIQALKLGMQALLRDRLVQAHRTFTEQGFCTISDKDNFNNMYKQYHSLGENGVMDTLHEEVMKLPVK